MAYRLNQTFSICEFDEVRDEVVDKYVRVSPPAGDIRGTIIADLCNIRYSADANREAFRKYEDQFSYMRHNGAFEALHNAADGKNAPLDQSTSAYEFFGRLWIYDMMIVDPEKMNNVPDQLDDREFLTDAGKMPCNDKTRD